MSDQKHPLDKFYTKSEVVRSCLEEINLKDYVTIIEPSAGSGAFSDLIPDCIALDLAPEAAGIIKQDWLEYNYTKKEGERILVIGNPPFGRGGNLALKFINHAATFADTIAFILPISFKKQFLQNRVNLNFSIVSEKVLPKKSFLLNGEPYDVKCVFQVWQKSTVARTKPTKSELVSNNLFKYVKKDDSPDLVINDISGKASKDWQNKKIKHNFFVKFHKEENIDEIIKKLNELDHPYKFWTVGPQAISRLELNQTINKNFIQ
jgi:hypothetical protein